MDRRRTELTVRAPFDGQLVAPELHEMVGQFLQERRGDRHGRHARPAGQSTSLVEQSDVQLLIVERTATGCANVVAEVRFAGDVLHTYEVGHPRCTGVPSAVPASRR